jgi:hypothetical protein
MHIERMLQTIKDNKFQIFNAEELGFVNYSDEELIDLLKLSNKQTSDPASEVEIQVIPDHAENLRKILQAIDRLDDSNYLTQLSDLPSSFRMINIHLLSNRLIHENSRLFHDHSLSFFANLYFTPNEQHNALGLNFDNAHIFVHQIRGAKSWTLLDEFSNGQYLELDLSSLNINESSSKVKTILTEDVLLYIPAKMPHKAVAVGGESSTHLTYAFREISTRASVVEFVVSKILKEMNVGQSRFEVFMGHETDIVKAMLECVNRMDVAKITRELKLMQTIRSKDILQNGMRMRRQ